MLVEYTNIFGTKFQTYSKRVPLIAKRDLLVKEIKDSGILRREMELKNSPKIISLNRRIARITE